LPTIDGPEKNNLFSKIKGNIIIQHRLDNGYLQGLTCITLPELKEKTIYPMEDEKSFFTEAISNITFNGEFVLLTENSIADAELYDLRKYNIGKKQEKILTKINKPGKSIALSNDGNKIAFIDGANGMQFPGAYLSRGKIEIFEGSSKNNDLLNLNALDEGIEWTPDGKKIIFVDIIERNKLDSNNKPNGIFGKTFKEWAYIPAIFVWDFIKKEKYFLAVGVSPKISTNGKNVIYRDFEYNFRRINLETKEKIEVKIPGIYGDVIYYLDNEEVIYWGLPTKGSPVKRSIYGSFKSGTQEITIKIAEINTKNFQTIIPFYDPRHLITFGLSN